ncbi:tetratricopeptide repeat protein [Glaciecola siphonariae]|uniref:Tetratricopeptide repeat protein n=1 Tax=Glaciecola siphonariae TaxID=521012 RepID=A0ABV9LVG5_9ALTE
MKNLNKHIHKSVALCSLLVMSAAPTLVQAQQEAAIVCPGYKQPKTQLLGERTGKKLQTAFEAYNEERLNDAVSLLREIEPKEEFDKASVERFLGQILVSMDGDNAPEALKLLESAAGRKVLNDRDQADLMKLNGDLSLQEEKYGNAVKWYNQWMEFTCKEDAQTYTKIAKGYTELKEFDKVVEAANKAIALADKPDKNPYALKVNAFHETKNYPAAVETVETLVELFPEEKNWWTQLGFFYMLVENYDKALATFALAYKQGYLSKKSEYKALIQLYASNDIPFKSAELHEKYMMAGEIENDGSSVASLANTLHQAKEYKEAAKFYAQAAKMTKDPEYYRKQGALLLTAEDYKGAITALNSALNSNIDDKSKVHFSLMEANFYAGNYRKAFEHAEEARKDASMRRNASAWIPYIKEKAKNRGIRL